MQLPRFVLDGPVRLLGATIAPFLIVPCLLQAQQWNGPRALELIDRARSERQAVRTDADFSTYRAEAQGFVYFFVDRPDTDEKTLVKTDQVALEMYWQAPNRTKQRIVGLRDRKELPTNIRYHLDHLTVVQDDFQDRIRLGDGDEVRDVVHPVAPGAEGVYDFRLGDSLTVRLPGAGGEVRVYEVEVRPRSLDAPGFVGSVFLDRTTAAIVRMRFTFTPASYVDPYLDYIRISLDNMLWTGGHWLPYRQEAELRRELPALDFLAGSVIRGRFEIGGYEFNEPLPPGIFANPGVSRASDEDLQTFAFQDSIYSDVEREGLSTPPSLTEIRDQARAIVQDRYLSGLSRLRLHLPSASSALRYNRAEGGFAGLGTTLRPGGRWTLKNHLGYAFGRERPSMSFRLLSGESERTGLVVEAYLNRLRDMGPVSGSSGVLNSLATVLADEDWLDPWFAAGGSLSFAGNRSHASTLGAVPSITVLWERHRSAQRIVGGATSDLRPVRPAEEGELVALDGHLRWGDGAEVANGWGLEVSGGPRRFEGQWLGGGSLAAVWARSGAWRTLELRARLDAGTVAGDDIPPQFLFLLGGRETLLGHPYRSAIGRHFWLIRAEAERPLLQPWISARAFASAGRAGGLDPIEDLPVGWTDLETDLGARISVGGGFSFLWEVIRMDVGRGVGAGGDWDTALSVVHRFRRWL